MTKRWILASGCPSDFAASIGQSALLSQLLWNRGLRTKEDAEAFLHPSWEKGIHDPRTFRHMDRAVDRVFRALEHGEKITVHGDYDADGVTGSALLMTTLREMEKKIARGPSTSSRPGRDSAQDDQCSLIDFYIPHREKEGYGLHKDTVPILQARGTGLLITVDCGIACPNEICLAKRQGMDTIVVDHHEFGDALPDGYLIHPGLPEETYPFKKLAAVGVAYKFACALLDEARHRGISIPEGWEKWLLDLVAIATVTDMVPLVGENRLLEVFGLRVLNKTRRPGLKALIELAGLVPGSLTTESVGFGIGPRLNAAGRMDHASLALHLLLAETEEEAKSLALELEQRNRDRQLAMRRMMDAAEQKIAEWVSTKSLPRILVLWEKEWSPSLVGLVAGRYVEKIGRPVVAIGHFEGRWVGSGRSVSPFNITEAVRAAGEGILTRVGGHVQACGFSLEQESALPHFAKKLDAQASHLSENELEPTLLIDAELSLSDLTDTLESLLVSFEPFGEGSPRPQFVSYCCPVVAVDVMGQNSSHLRLALLDGRGRRIKAVGFKFGFRASEIPVGSFVDIVYHVVKNEWNGRASIECRLVDFQVCDL